MTGKDLPDYLRSIAKYLSDDSYLYPLGARQTLLDAAETVEQLRAENERLAGEVE